MKRCKTHMTYLVCIFMLSVFSILSGCSGGSEAGGGVWNQPPAAGAAGAAGDTTRPTVILTVPLTGATVATNARITATFSEAMTIATISTTSFTVQPSGPPLGVQVAGTVTYNATTRTATFTPPVGNFAAATPYTATITTLAKDLAGNALAANYVWTFTTGAGADAVAPLITATLPANLAVGVLATTKTITATFNEDMDPALFDATTFTLQTTGPPLGALLPGSYSYNALTNTVTFAPTADLAPDTPYTATVTNGVTDLAGNPLVVPAVGGLPKPNPWTFRTAAAVAPAINLGAAANFGIASRAGMTSTGVTVVNGNVALWPLGVCTDATGAPANCLVESKPASATGLTVNGTIRFPTDSDAGATASAVTTDLTAAYNEGMAKVNTQPAIAANEMGGKTFIPGVYENANLTLAAGGIAQLDGQNDPNAIFIFKVTLGGDFIDSGTLLLPSRINLINQAQAKNVWFIIGRDITIGSGTTWNGNILANRTVTVLDGSTVTGRVLGGAGGAGAITLTGAAFPSVTTITVP